MIDGKPQNLGIRSAGCNVIILVTGNGGDGKALCIVCSALAVTVDDIVYGSLIPAVEYANVQQVLPEERLVCNLCNAELAVTANHNNL